MPAALEHGSHCQCLTHHVPEITDIPTYVINRKLASVDYNALLQLAAGAEGEELRTQTGAPFQVKVENQKIFFLIGASHRRRSDPIERHVQFVERFNRYGSLSPVDYEDITKNATYLVALVRHI